MTHYHCFILDFFDLSVKFKAFFLESKISSGISEWEKVTIERLCTQLRDKFPWTSIDTRPSYIWLPSYGKIFGFFPRAMKSEFNNSLVRMNTCYGELYHPRSLPAFQQCKYVILWCFYVDATKVTMRTTLWSTKHVVYKRRTKKKANLLQTTFHDRLNDFSSAC